DEDFLDDIHSEDDSDTAVDAQVHRVNPSDVRREKSDIAKTINFGIIYGVTPFGLARRIRGMDVKSAGELITGYKQRFAGIERFMQECVQHALDQGFVSTIMGRRRYIPEVRHPSHTVRNLGVRLAINSVIQGSAADLIKIAMVRV